MEQNSSDFVIQNDRTFSHLFMFPAKVPFIDWKQSCMYFLARRTLLVFSKRIDVLWCLSTVTSRCVSEFQTVSETVPWF